MFKFYVYKFGQFCVSRLPVSLSYRLAVILSDIHYFFSFRDRRAVKDNLRVILPEGEDLAANVRLVFRNFGKYLVDFFRMFDVVNKDFIQQNVKIENLEYIDEVLQKGKGAILLTAHIGNWELGGVVLSILGYPSLVIALPHKERPVNDLFNKQRETWGLSVVPLNQAVRRCLSTLKENGIISVVADRDFTSNGKPMDFFHKKALLPKGAALFSAKTGAAIVPVFLVRTKDDGYVLQAEKPIYPAMTIEGQVSDDVLLGIMQQYKVIIEDKIRQYPTQWLMFRRFWMD